MRGRGRLAAALVMAACAAGAGGAAGQEAPPDTSGTMPLLERLQQADREFYSDEIVDLDRAIADSGLAVLDSLGYEEFARSRMRAARAGRIEYSGGGPLATFNRVEGLVAGAGVTGRAPLATGIDFALHAGYATASEKLRYAAELRAPVRWGPSAPEAVVGFSDRVVPYGSNRPVANALRAVFGSVDDQDYLRRVGGGGGIDWEPRRRGRGSLRYEGTRETSVGRHTDFSIAGDHRLMGRNRGVDEGYDRAVEAAWSAGSAPGARQWFEVRHRVAGGGLGGDFAYTRFDAAAGARRYLPLSLEAVIDVAHARAGGAPPVQRLPDAGGLSTVRGYDRRSQVGRESLCGRLEVLVPFDVLGATGVPLLEDARLQFVTWADAGRVWRGFSTGWMASGGLGIQRYLGPFGRGAFLRFDAAFPAGPDRPETSRFYLYFARGFF